MIGLCYNEYSILSIVGYIWYSREYASGMMIDLLGNRFMISMCLVLLLWVETIRHISRSVSSMCIYPI